MCIKNRMLLYLRNNQEELLVLDNKVFENDEEYVTQADVVVDEANELGSASYRLIDDMMIGEERRQCVYKALDSLPSREREVVQLLYGVGIRDAMNIQEVAMLIGVSTARVGQIKESALRRLENVKC